MAWVNPFAQWVIQVWKTTLMPRFGGISIRNLNSSTWAVRRENCSVRNGFNFRPIIDVCCNETHGVIDADVQESRGIAE